MLPTAHGVVSQGGKAPRPPVGARGAPAYHSETGWRSPLSVAWETGWRFTVGPNDLAAQALLLFSEAGGTETVNLYRVADQTLLASAEITSPGGWAEVAIPLVTLQAGQTYMVSRYPPGGTPVAGSNPTRTVDGVLRPLPIDPSITYEGTYYNASGGFPNTAGSVLPGANVRFAAPASGYRFVRLNISAVAGGDLIRVRRLVYREAVGGADVTGAGVPFESSVNTASSASGHLYVENTSDWLVSTAVTAAWAAYDFGSGNPKEIAEYAVTCSTQVARAPRDWVLEGSNDLVTWDAIHTVTGATGWGSVQTRVYTP